MKWGSEREVLPESFDGGLSSHMVMQGHVSGDVFDMCWAYRGASVAGAAAVQQEQPEADLPV